MVNYKQFRLNKKLKNGLKIGNYGRHNAKQ